MQTPVELIFSELSLKKATHFESVSYNSHSDHIGLAQYGLFSRVRFSRVQFGRVWFSRSRSLY